jgi:hypothetical protein
MKTLKNVLVPLVISALSLAAGCGKKSVDYYGEERQFQGAGAMAEHGLSGPHDPTEPSTFNQSWVGSEVYEVLQNAKRGDYSIGSVSTSGGPCTIFHDNKLVRRLLIGNGRPYEATDEVTFTSAGEMVMWFRSDRADDPTWEWAYFQHGSSLALYQRKGPGEARTTAQARSGLANDIYQRVGACLSKFGATNPLPGTSNSGGAQNGNNGAQNNPSSGQPVGIKLAKVNFAVGEDVTIQFTTALSPPQGQKYWLTLAPAGAGDEAWGTWHYVPMGATADSVKPTQPGDYEVRLHDLYPQYPNGRVIARQRISVQPGE